MRYTAAQTRAEVQPTAQKWLRWHLPFAEQLQARLLITQQQQKEGKPRFMYVQNHIKLNKEKYRRCFISVWVYSDGKKIIFTAN